MTISESLVLKVFQDDSTAKLYTINETRGWEGEQSIYYTDSGNDMCRH